MLREANNLLINWWNNRLGSILSRIVFLMWLCSHAAIPPENTHWRYIAWRNVKNVNQILHFLLSNGIRLTISVDILEEAFRVRPGKPYTVWKRFSQATWSHRFEFSYVAAGCFLNEWINALFRGVNESCVMHIISRKRDLKMSLKCFEIYIIGE